ncbi:hypothetical protein J1N35_008159 [Gossypium stocksii]|uniref:Uncharacterized protein n=1 Tax=Gossypium stocksii TaxID=47602 RepID=A0A9D4AGE9_9ROSI|nr:hypothetical protein J1N35_008159 [Gossypium stocksii]
MDSKGKQDYKESAVSLKHVTIQELEVDASLPTLGNDNLELGTKAQTLVVREVSEEVFEARIRETSETLQARCMDCEKKKDRSSLRLEPCSTKHVRMHLSNNKGSADSASMGKKGASVKVSAKVLAENERVASSPNFKQRRVSVVWDFLPGYGRVTASNFGLSRQIVVDQSSQGKW